MKNKEINDNRLNTWGSLSFKIGAVISITLIAAGLALICVVGTKANEPAIPLSQLWQGLLELNATAFITLGILTLLLTPILQVLVTTVNFCINKDKLFIVISTAIICILVLSLVLALV